MTRHPLAQYCQLVAANARDALQEGFLPRLQLDQLHALQCLRQHAHARVLHFHPLLLDVSRTVGKEVDEWEQSESDESDRDGGPAELCVRRREGGHSTVEHDQGNDDLEGSGPNGLDVSLSEEKRVGMRGRVFQLVAVSFHHAQNLALAVL